MKDDSTNWAIFIACDRRMVHHAKILLKSLESNYPDHPPVFLHTKGLNATELEVFNQYSDVHQFLLEA